MPLNLFDRVKETCSSPGVGSVTLLGAVLGFQSFAIIGNGNTCYYAIADQYGANWEVGIGTYTLSGTILARTTVLSSSAGGTTKANFSSGTQDVFVTYPAEKSFSTDMILNVVNGGTGLASLTAGYIPYGNGTSAFNNSANFSYNGATLTVNSTDPGWSGFTSVRVGYYGSTYSTNGGYGGIGLNVYNNGTNWTYINTTYASRYEQILGTGHAWFNAPSGTAGTTPTFSQDMTLFRSGGLSIGNTTDPGSTNLSVTGTIVSATTVKTGGYTVATLPTGVTGARAYVTNALTPVFGATVVGGGSVTMPVFDNGTNWIVV